MKKLIRKKFLSFPLPITLLTVLIFSCTTGLFAEVAAKIEYELDPPAAEIGPDVDVARLSIRVSQSDDGAPVPAELRIELDAPPGHVLVPTDFPVVEGTQLIRAGARATDGEHTLRYLFPIRGEYRLRVTAAPPAGETHAWQPVQQEFRFTLNENQNEVMNLFTLLGGLFVFGCVAGVTLGRSAKAAAEH